jgi:hypothetical protein
MIKRRIIVDGIRVEGIEARRIVDEVMRDVDERGQPRRLAPPGLMAGAIILATVFSCVAGMLVQRFVGGAVGPWMVAVGLATGLTVGAVWGRTYMRFQRRQIRQAMRRRGFDLCPECGYRLKGLCENSTRCPECGAAREGIEESIVDGTDG